MSTGILGTIAGLFEFFTGLLGFFIGGIIAIVCAVVAIALFIIEGYCLYCMAKKVGFKYAWFAYIPFLRTYLEFHIPAEDFNLWNIVKVKDRNMLALVCIIGPIVLEPVCTWLTSMPYIGFLFAPLGIILNVLVLIERWKRMYDVMKTFGMGTAAIPLSILSTVFPLVYTVTLLVIFRRDPVGLRPAGEFKEIE